MRRSASEILNNLERRVARLERKVARPHFERTWGEDQYPPSEIQDEVSRLITKELKKEGVSFTQRFKTSWQIHNGADFLMGFMQSNKFDSTSKSNARVILREQGKIDGVIVDFYNVQMELRYSPSKDEAYLSFWYDKWRDDYGF